MGSRVVTVLRPLPFSSRYPGLGRALRYFHRFKAGNR